MKTILSRRHFLKKTSAGLTGAAVVSTVDSISLYGIAATKQTTTEEFSLFKLFFSFNM